MTQDQPDAAALLAIARATLAADVLPALEGGRRLAAQMVANALGIAEREIAAAPPDAATAARAAEDAALAAAIRAGTHDGARAVHAALLADAEARVAVSNPKFR